MHPDCRTFGDRLRWRAGEALIVVFVIIFGTWGFIRDADIRAAVFRISGSGIDTLVCKFAGLFEPLIGPRVRVAFIEWYGEKRGWEIFKPHRMSKEQIERSD